MKSAEEWVAQALTGELSHLSEEDCVRQIQADALRHAANIAANLTDTVGNEFDGKLIMQAGGKKIAEQLCKEADQIEKGKE